MAFEAPFECGRRLTVTAGEAGSTRACPCGRQVVLPALSQLRAAAPVFTRSRVSLSDSERQATRQRQATQQRSIS
jgi:hypothetical protein